MYYTQNSLLRTKRPLLKGTFFFFFGGGPGKEPEAVEKAETFGCLRALGFQWSGVLD